MGRIEPCQLQDIGAVADLHRRIFHHKVLPASEALKSYYRQLFFENPWRTEELPSLVWRESDGTINGFMGVVPRPMLYEQKSIRVVVGHRLMVAGHLPNHAMVAARMIRTCLAGKQDLFLNDGSTEAARKLVTAAGGVTLPQYSMKWICPVRPLSWYLGRAGQRRKIKPLAALAAPLARAGDRLLRSVSHSPTLTAEAADTLEPLSDQLLLESIKLAAARLTLRPVYDLESLRWMLDFMNDDHFRGTIDGFALRRQGRLLGACLYYHNPRGGYEVIVVAGTGPPATRALLLALLARAYHEGATHVFGRFEPCLAEPLWELRCHLSPSPDCWAITHAADPRLVEQVVMGKIFLSNLESELWMGVPMSYDD